MSALDDRDKDPNLDEYAYEHRVENPVGGGGADEHADNPHPDADGVATEGDADPVDPDTSGVVDPDAD